MQYINVLDTPGFKDAEDFARDDKMIKLIEQAFKTQVEHLDYVCICVKASDEHLTTDLIYVFSRLCGLFGKGLDLEPRIVFMITHCSGIEGEAEPKCVPALKQSLPYNRYMKFNNKVLTTTLVKDSLNVLVEPIWDLNTSILNEFF